MFIIISLITLVGCEYNRNPTHSVSQISGEKFEYHSLKNPEYIWIDSLHVAIPIVSGVTKVESKEDTIVFSFPDIYADEPGTKIAEGSAMYIENKTTKESELEQLLAQKCATRHLIQEQKVQSEVQHYLNSCNGQNFFVLRNENGIFEVAVQGNRQDFDTFWSMLLEARTAKPIIATDGWKTFSMNDLRLNVILPPTAYIEASQDRKQYFISSIDPTLFVEYMERNDVDRYFDFSIFSLDIGDAKTIQEWALHFCRESKTPNDILRTYSEPSQDLDLEKIRSSCGGNNQYILRIGKNYYRVIAGNDTRDNAAIWWILSKAMIYGT
jgi:hypothetical protein